MDNVLFLRILSQYADSFTINYPNKDFMAKRIFSYPWTAEEEAQGIRTLLQSHQIDFFETPASRWGFSHAAIWLKNDNDLEKTRVLLQQHHHQYAEQARRQYQQETGYDPHASFLERAAFAVKYNFKRRLVLLLVGCGFFVIFLYFYLFFKLFHR